MVFERYTRFKKRFANLFIDKTIKYQFEM